MVARHCAPSEHDARRRIVPLRAPAIHHVHLGNDRQAQGHLPHDRWLLDPSRDHLQPRLRHQGRDRHLLDGRRHWLDHRPQLHRVRTTDQWRHPGPLRRPTRFGRQGPLVDHHRAVQSHDALHRADDHSHADEVGPPDSRRARSLLAAHPRFSGRAHQSRGMDVVPRTHRSQQLPDCGHVVADRDRRLDDCPAAGHFSNQARRRHACATRYQCRCRGQRRQQRGQW